MIYVFLGKDINILNSKINALIDKLNINNIIRYDAEYISLIDVINEVNYVDLFNEKKLVIVNYFSFKKLEDNEEELLIRYLDNMSDNIIIFKCIDDSLDERKKVIKLLKEKANITKCDKLDYRELHSYLEDFFKENNIKIDYNSVSRIMFLCDNNTDISINESKKLLLYKGDNSEITLEDVNNVVDKSNEKEIFVFNENILNKDVVGALESYKILVNAFIDESIIIDGMAKQFRMLYQLKYMLKDINYKEIARLLGVKDYTIQKLVPYTSKYNDEEIIDMLYRISLLDEKIKIFGYDKREVMETFIVSI